MGLHKKIIKNFETLGLLWRLRGKECTCQFKRHGFSSRLEKIPHASEQLNPCTATIMPVLKNPRAAVTEPTCHNYRNPCTLESVLSLCRLVSRIRSRDEPVCFLGFLTSAWRGGGGIPDGLHPRPAFPHPSIDITAS